MLSNVSRKDSGITSDSDSKEKLLEKRWTQVLLNWINLCIQPGTEVQELNPKVFLDIISKYQDDICDDDKDRELLCSDGVEPFIKYKYPILQLRHLSEDSEVQRKLYVMTSVILFHCCISSRSGAVDADICRHLVPPQQELVLKFCENLGEMEVTINNIEAAITGAFKTTSDVNFTVLDSKPIPKTEPITSTKDIPLESKPTQESSLTVAISKLLTPTTALTFKTPVTVLPSAIVADSSKDISDFSNYSRSFSFDDMENESDSSTIIEDSSMTVYNVQSGKRGVKFQELEVYASGSSAGNNLLQFRVHKTFFSFSPWGFNQEDSNAKCQPVCSCTACSSAKNGCGDTGDMSKCNSVMSLRRCTRKEREIPFNWVKWFKVIGVMVAIGVLLAVALIPFMRPPPPEPPKPTPKQTPRRRTQYMFVQNFQWECKRGLCEKVFEGIVGETYFASLSRCTLLCNGPLLWPYPIGYTSFSNKIVAIGKGQLEYKFQTITSVIVQQYLAEAFKLFRGDLGRLERIDLQKKTNGSHDLLAKKLYIEMGVETDPDPRMRTDTEESYSLRIDSTQSHVKVAITSHSFSGVRHGLETLSQLILLDQSTGLLITLSNVIIKDAPSYGYRGLMIDTGRNYIPVPDLMRTIDAMASVKLNTFHWRISDVTSFPLLLSDIPELFEFGAYDRSMIYTTEDVRTLVNRAALRGIRILLEVAVPGPVGRAWSWHADAFCQKAGPAGCDEELCRRLKMEDRVFDLLEIIYRNIIELTKVDDIFHLSDGMFSLVDCFYLLDSREGFLNDALDRLRNANKGLPPKLPIIWYTAHLTRPTEAQDWAQLGVQLNEWHTNPPAEFLSNYKVIHSSRWDLSCEMKVHRCHKYRTWQDMYEWKAWKTLEVLTIEGGEVTLWTDLVDTTNLDTHLWPRAAAVAERLWSDKIANQSAGIREYLRLDAQRWRMLLRSVRVQPVWPIWCTFHPKPCLERIR